MNSWLILLGAVAIAAPPEEAPFTVASSKPLPALTERFQRTEGWTGGDGASSIRLGPRRTLWLFADSFVGAIEDGRRVRTRMVNNAAAWQMFSEDKAPLRFFLGTSAKEPAALLRPPQADAWYWPGDGALVGDQLYLFCKLVRKAEGAPGFGFDWFGNELLQISNPQDEPTTWKIQRARLPGGAEAPRLGAACLLEGDYLYAYGLFPAAACKPLEAPLALARIHRDKLAAHDAKDWRYWCRGAKGNQWSEQPNDLVPLFRDAAPEMTVHQVRGIEGYVATYTSVGLGRDIVIRHAPRPEGPWSKPVRVYRCPEVEDKLLLYGAKAHVELAELDGQLIITYCRNIGSLAEDVRRPDIYFPQGVEVRLRAR